MVTQRDILGEVMTVVAMRAASQIAKQIPDREARVAVGIATLAMLMADYSHDQFVDTASRVEAMLLESMRDRENFRVEREQQANPS